MGENSELGFVIRPLALGLAEAAAVLGISQHSFERGLADGRIPCGVRIGGRRLWPVRMLEDWLEAGAPPVAQWPPDATAGPAAG